MFVVWHHGWTILEVILQGHPWELHRHVEVDSLLLTFLF
jgi:hypothetical protein